MFEETTRAIEFLGTFLKHSNVTESQLGVFKAHLKELMLQKFQKKSWSIEFPDVASAYRAMSISRGKVDPIILEAGRIAAISSIELKPCFPDEFFLWVDPGCVSYKFGEYGSVGILHRAKEYTSNSFAICAQIVDGRRPIESQIH
jgi:hypothetical protein